MQHGHDLRADAFNSFARLAGNFLPTTSRRRRLEYTCDGRALVASQVATILVTLQMNASKRACHGRTHPAIHGTVYAPPALMSFLWKSLEHAFVGQISKHASQ